MIHFAVDGMLIVCLLFRSVCCEYFYPQFSCLFFTVKNKLNLLKFIFFLFILFS
jgi:hypothetical protein